MATQEMAQSVPDLIALADRLEAAVGPDRHLGREVLLACEKGFVSPLYHWMDPTASLDSAMTLVPEGWTYWMIENMRIGTGNDGARVEVSRLINDDEDRAIGHAATPALALCAAALRARTAQLS